jgi:hypothetical protein
MPEEEIIEEEVVEETPEEEVVEEVVEEDVIEEQPMEEPIVEEEPAVPTKPMVTLPFSITNTRENLVIIAKDRGYPTEVLRDGVTDETPLEDRFIPNPVDPIDWLNEHIKDFLADVASKPFIDAQKRAAEAQIKAGAEVVKHIARQSIS